MHTQPRPAHGGAWLAVDDESQIGYRVDPGGTIEFTFFGPMELAISMSAGAVNRCREVLDEAITEIHEGRHG